MGPFPLPPLYNLQTKLLRDRSCFSPCYVDVFLSLLSFVFISSGNNNEYRLFRGRQTDGKRERDMQVERERQSKKEKDRERYRN